MNSLGKSMISMKIHQHRYVFLANPLIFEAKYQPLSSKTITFAESLRFFFVFVSQTLLGGGRGLPAPPGLTDLALRSNCS